MAAIIKINQNKEAQYCTGRCKSNYKRLRTRIVYENIFVKTIKDVHVHETKSYLFVKIKHHLVRDPSRITF
jgi:hypothetical protein